MKDKKISATELILKELLPLAKEGLKMRKVRSSDINKYLGIIEARAKEHRTGARWALRSYTSLVNQVTPDEAVAGVTASIIKNQKDNKPVHTWKEPTAGDIEGWNPQEVKVEEFMSTDLFTVQKDDPIDLVAEIMNWRRIRYMPVENNKGELVGLISSRMLLRYYARPEKMELEHITTVKDIMVEKPITATPETTIMEAMKRMRDNNIGCLPVVKGKDLVGVITEMDFLRITGRLMDKLEQQQKGK
jgi:CBS domain-containing protein